MVPLTFYRKIVEFRPIIWPFSPKISYYPYLASNIFRAKKEVALTYGLENPFSPAGGDKVPLEVEVKRVTRKPPTSPFCFNPPPPWPKLTINVLFFSGFRLRYLSSGIKVGVGKSETITTLRAGRMGRLLLQGGDGYCRIGWLLPHGEVIEVRHEVIMEAVLKSTSWSPSLQKAKSSYLRNFFLSYVTLFVSFDSVQRLNDAVCTRPFHLRSCGKIFLRK